MPRKAYEKAYGTKLGSGLEVPLHDTNGWYTQDTVRVTEYWLIKETKTEMALLEGGEVCRGDKVPEGRQAEAQAQRSAQVGLHVPDHGTRILAGPVRAADRPRADHPRRGLGDQRRRQAGPLGPGALRRDPQRLKNYWRSVSAEMLALAPKGKWLLTRPGGRRDEFRDAVTTDDPVLSGRAEQKPEYIGPPTLNAASCKNRR
jgi:hypothetical protein